MLGYSHYDFCRSENHLLYMRIYVEIWTRNGQETDKKRTRKNQKNIDSSFLRIRYHIKRPIPTAINKS